MTIYSFGDIVLLAFPFTDTKQKKKRPALVLFDSNDGDVILCRITSKLTNTDYDYIIEDYAKGVYTLQIIAGEEVINKKVVVEYLGFRQVSSITIPNTRESPIKVAKQTEINKKMLSLLK